MSPVDQQGRDYGRSMVISRRGIAATSQVQASQSAAQILASGGSAVDAAIAANAVLAVLEPMQCGPGGDLFVLHWEAASGKLTGLNASGPAPRALSPEVLAAKGFDAMPQEGIHSVTVPGAVDGWGRLHVSFGKLPWKNLFQDAIALAAEGFPVAEAIAEVWADPVGLAKIHANPATARIFLPVGKLPCEGDVFCNRDMARALSLIAEEGPGTLYKGEVARAILKTSQSLGGTMTAEDLAGFSAEWVEPVSIDYRGWRVFELPPNSQGIAALEMLNIMETSPADADGPHSPAELHKRIEAMKLAYADVRRYNADPRFYKSPVDELLSKAYARARAKRIKSAKANCDVPAGQPIAGDTTYLTVVDKDGNIVSWIQSIYTGFASAVTVGGMGFLLQNRGGGFMLDPSHPNVLAGGKRPFHTIIPGFMERGDQHIGFGIMGGPNQPLAHAQFVSNVVDYGMNIQAAIEAPRFTKYTANGCDVAIESRMPPETLRELAARGHEILLRREFTQEMGRGQAILHNSQAGVHDSRTGINYAASDPRADGAAIPEPML
jgi:gamma-glutamyltranspeptidase/glutathione hydrolase